MRHRFLWLFLEIGLFVVGCTPTSNMPLPTLQPIAVVPVVQGGLATPAELPPTYTAVPPWQPSPTPTSTPIPTPTTTPVIIPSDPYEPYTVAYLSTRAYGQGGDLRLEETLAETADFTRYVISYPSDGLTIYGFMNVPKTDGPHPVVFVLHGYWPLADYNTVGYTASYADALAKAGYIAIHPNYRNHPPS